MNSLVLLAGCGLGDGSCIEETVLTYLALEKYKCSYQAVALDLSAKSVNHISEEVEEARNILVESARIGRGTIKELDSVNADNFDCLIIPGGIGLVSNYGNLESIRELVLSFWEHHKPIATMCAGIDFLRKILGDDLLREEYQQLSPDGFCCDRDRRVFYTPAFRMTGSLCEVQRGIDRMIGNLGSTR